MPHDPNAFDAILAEAIREFTQTGFTSQDRLDYWVARLRHAAEQELSNPASIEQKLRFGLETIVQRVTRGQRLLDLHPGVARFTIERLKPEMRADLNRRVHASAALIKLNQKEMTDQTMRRFQGWATSVPAGGSKVVNRREVKEQIRKPLKSLPFTQRRVLIDQGHKLVASISEVIANDGGAIAAEWHSHWREGVPPGTDAPGTYHYRPEHKARDRKVYAIRGNWAAEQGMMKVGPDGYYDDHEKVGELPFCRCWCSFVYSIRDLPDEMITVKGREELARVRALIAA